ncbi:hypothetical protein TI39_contig4365g00001 [Zymoseptoria brevis]|uniref:Uncharacterized protein n=1 Tax=Zymoseptoria brevis TaxID=1047168 RepID=A0A0F4GAH3_9PEZI|nr:hypothetical protein TI39_contig4365g00001 [Zymoseptoria brevis]
MHSTLTFVLLGASLTLAVERKQPDVQVGHTIKIRTLPGSNLFLRQYESCDIGYTECGPACMLISSECCVSSGGMGSCPIGYYCDGTGAEAGCCERGKICSGLSGECTDRSKRCGDGCIPESETCDESDSPTPTGTSSGSSPTSTSSGGTTSGGESVLSCDVGEEECDTGYDLFSADDHFFADDFYHHSEQDHWYIDANERRNVFSFAFSFWRR